jgi:hypothetical protein
VGNPQLPDNLAATIRARSGRIALRQQQSIHPLRSNGAYSECSAYGTVDTARYRDDQPSTSKMAAKQFTEPRTDLLDLGSFVEAQEFG